MTTKVLLVGATGPTGRQIMARAKTEDLATRAMSRHPENLADAAGAVRELATPLDHQQSANLTY